MFDPSRGRAATPWRVFLACYVVSLRVGLGTQLAQGSLRIGPAELAAPALMAGLLTLLWWLAWGRKGR